ncbi:hypothetical protein [Streptomyces olivochromogenes]|uniref:hypothetical protein n=1 Tax=Streptomyces olivochromogenes TaxID=1963 RepID=UPI001F30EC81|nr:hypothetical protein [Streptomyces olivochromogenes]MCF3133798.1 hypothetical protein [Streptomyces olivochromogenes]
MRFAVTILRPAGYQHWEAFKEVATTVHLALLRLGHDSVLTHDPRLPGRRHIIFGSNLLANHPNPIDLFPEDHILYNLDQVSPDSPWITRGLLDLFRKHKTWDYSARNITELERMGVGGVQHVPIGYVPELEQMRSAAEEDIDVLFIGSLNERRLAPIRHLASEGLNAVARFGLYGEARDALMARAKVVLNVHFYEAKIFEIVRVSYLLANGRFVVSEHGCDAEEEAQYAAGLAFTDYAKITDTCRHYVEHADERRSRAETGRELMRSNLATDFLRPAIAAL